METPALLAARRDILGKKARFLRRQGITPTHLFGRNVESLSLQCDTVQLERIIARAGTARIVNLEIEAGKPPLSILIREIQRDACTDSLVHVDFYQLNKTEEITADIPVVLVGEAPAMKLKGRILLQPLTRLAVRCLPDQLPPQIEVDLSHLEEAERGIYVKDITLGPGITVITAPEQMVVKVSEAALVPEVEDEAEAGEPSVETAGEETAGSGK